MYARRLVHVLVATSIVAVVTLIPSPQARAARACKYHGHRAICLGPSDDIQKAIDNHAGGTIFRLAAGTWNVSSAIRPKTGDQLIGHGPSKTTIAGATSDDCIDGRGTGIEIAALTVTHCLVGIRPASGWRIHGVRAVADTVGIRIAGDRVILRASRLLRNRQFGLLATGSKDRVVGNEIAYNRTDTSFDTGTSGGTKWVNAVDNLVKGNDVHDNRGNGLWTDEDSRGVIFERNVVTGNVGDGIRIEISSDAQVLGNRVRGNREEAIALVNSSGTLVRGNRVASPVAGGYVIRFLGNGRTSGGVEYTNTDNHAVRNKVVFTSRRQLYGVVCSGGTTRNNSFQGNDYVGPAKKARYFKWWNGSSNVRTTWSTWRRRFGQDLTGTFRT